MIVVDAASGEPPFEQVRAQLAAQIRTGELAPGERLPTVRRLAEDLGIAANTVARAYRELETEGLVATGGRNGTTVAWSPDAGRRELEQLAARFAERARALGTDPREARGLVDRALGLDR
ncbi:GntR family transcriptional regulator [Amnibacterium sp. CER49]|uniref:GntR family transcriptional regulator n=1 Tax=Amnibacterium sp. CER49 TaxID=3039161 RepID=UPI002447493D|nr:GntR family transcriptional regulator [Amnibacterium sp. CER49]MDH2442632.1 GntR family transcriptional regulator [Amnibacterium sp. CER49]